MGSNLRVLYQNYVGMVVIEPLGAIMIRLGGMRLTICIALTSHATKDLAMVLVPALLYGTFGLALSWNRNSWQLDTVPPIDQEVLLKSVDLLPLSPPAPQ
jgi:hypothetical protein